VSSMSCLPEWLATSRRFDSTNHLSPKKAVTAMNTKITSRVSSAILVSLAVFGAQSTASAANTTNLIDSFEVNRAPPWSFDGGGNIASFWAHNPRMAYDGSYSAYLWATGPNAWSSVGRSVTMQGWTSANPGHCNLSFRVASTSSWSVFNVEVIDPVTWTYIGLSTWTVSDSWGWIPVSVNNWVPTRSSVFVRISLTSSTANDQQTALIDYMTTHCS
jgi:hypothetical protein